MTRIIDADSHFMEPLDLWPRYIESRYRDRCLRFERDAATDQHVLLIDGQRITHSGDLTIEELMGVAVGYGQKERGQGLKSFDFAAAFSQSLEDMGQRLQFLDQEGIESQFIYPTLGLFWEDLVTDPALAAAHSRAYNTWMLQACTGYRNRLYPVGHITLRHPAEAVRELERVSESRGTDSLRRRAADRRQKLRSSGLRSRVGRRARARSRRRSPSRCARQIPRE